MNILHIWDQAGVASVIAKWQCRIGHNAHVIKNIKHDKMKITSYYNGILVKNKYVFVFKSILLARKYDIIHLHDAWFMVNFIKMLFPEKKMVMHYHGSLVRMTPFQKRAKWERLVDAIILATPDLLEYKYAKTPTYVPNPIDTELFSPREIPKNGLGFTSLKWDQTEQSVRNFLVGLPYAINLEIRPQKKYIEYSLLPAFLSGYEYYVDYPTYNGTVIKANSCLGLQCMALGLKVISYNGVISSTLDPVHSPNIAVSAIEKIYADLVL